jgi:hypothetical protein
VREAFIEGKARSEEEGFEKDGYSVRWNMENGLGLVFVVRYLSHSTRPELIPRTLAGRLPRSTAPDVHSRTPLADQGALLGALPALLADPRRFARGWNAGLDGCGR